MMECAPKIKTLIRSPLNWLWTSTGFCQGSPALHLIGVGAVLVFAATKMTIEGPGGIAQAILAVSGFIILIVHGRQLRNSAPVWFLLAVVAAQLLSWFAGYLSHPELINPPKVDRLARIFLLIPIAWWLGGNTRNTLILWSIAAAGVFLMPWLLGSGWDDWRHGLAGRRVDFTEGNGFAARNAQHTAMLFGVVTLGLLVFAKRAVWEGRLVWWRLILWLGFFAAGVIAVIITQTRAVWLGLMCVLLAYAIGAMISIVLIPKQRQKLLKGSVTLLAGMLTLGMLTLGILAMLLGDDITKRLSHERQTIINVLDGRIDAIGYGSVGLRIHSWEAALDGIRERPLLGWGGAGKTSVLERSSDERLQALVAKGLGHLHNSYLEVLVEHGILGAATLAAFFIWLTWRAIQAWRANHMPSDLLVFYLGFLTFWMVVNFFESYLFFSTGIFVLNLVLAGVLTHIWRWQFASSPTSPSAGTEISAPVVNPAIYFTGRAEGKR